MDVVATDQLIVSGVNNDATPRFLTAVIDDLGCMTALLPRVMVRGVNEAEEKYRGWIHRLVFKLKPGKRKKSTEDGSTGWSIS